MNAKCASCEHAYSEDWGKDKKALRCGNPANGEYCGRVIGFFPAGHIKCVSDATPLWCILMKEVTAA